MTPAEDPLVLREVRSGVQRLVLNRAEKRNALDAALVTALTEALAEAEADPAVRVVAVEGAGKDFCSGADLASLQELGEAPVLENLADADRLAQLFLAIRGMGKPVVAVVRGRALAGGCGLATACDLVLAEESALFGYPEVKIGFVPAIVAAILSRNVSEKRAFELIARGDSVSAREAERIGLINRVVADGELEAESASYLSGLASRPRDALRLCKRILYQQDGMSFEAALRAGAQMNVIARLTEESRAGVATFVARRPGG